MTREPEFQVFDNPDAFLTCNKDPSKALCDFYRETRGPKDTRPPSLDRCNPACSNIAHTDQHIANARAEIARLQAEAKDPLTPIPLAQRLKQAWVRWRRSSSATSATAPRPAAGGRDRGQRDGT